MRNFWLRADHETACFEQADGSTNKYDKDDQFVLDYLANGGVFEEKFTPEIIADIKDKENIQIQDSMILEGNKLSLEDDNRISVGSSNIIADRPEHNSWMKSIYDDKDNSNTDLKKPPSKTRQKLAINRENKDLYIFTRYKDQWGYRWHLRLMREDVNALAIAIYDQDGNYLYTTGALISHPEGGWFTECPAGQADSTPE
ncbi:MAG: hypothetical protein KAH30_00265, partial [Caldisericia bacterium]|nr:hypothetical protein [Caldisericia bacterium]